MRIINIIESKEGVSIFSIESFGIFEEQLSDEVVEKAEELFKEKASENGADEEDIDEALENGYFSIGEYTITIVWSDI